MRPKLNASLFAMMLRELQLGPCSTTDIVTVTGMRREAILGWLAALHEKGCIHIAEWEAGPTGAEATRCPVYGLGEGRDAPKPRRLTSTEKHRRDRARAVQTVRMAA